MAIRTSTTTAAASSEAGPSGVDASDLGRQLEAMFAAVASAPLPPALNALVEALDRREAQLAQGSDRRAIRADRRN